LQGLSAGARAVARAMALFWTWRARSPVYELLRHMGVKSANGRDFTHEDLREAQKELRRADLLVEQDVRQGYSQLQDALRIALYRELLDDTPLRNLREALHTGEPYDGKPAYTRRPLWDIAAAVSLVRLELLGGSNAAKLVEMKLWVSRSHDWGTVLRTACFEAFDSALFERITPEWRWNLAYLAVSTVCLTWQADLLPVCRWALAKLESELDAIPAHLRLQLAELLLHRGEGTRIERVLAGDHGGAADALRAAVQVQQGRWPEAQAGFVVALKKRQLETGARKRLLPDTVAWLYPLALLAQQGPKHLELAKKFCLGEAGSRNPAPYDHWGVWVHAISVRLGDATLDKTALDLKSSPGRYLDRFDLWRCLLRAWLGAEAVGKMGGGRAFVPREQAIAALRERLQACGFAWLEAQIVAAEAVFAGREAPAHFFVAGGVESWRTVLASLQALGTESSAAGDAKAARLVWSIRLNKQGGLEEIEPLEQKRGLRGWSKPKPLPLAKLAGNEKLEPWDARVVRAIRKDPDYARRYTLDRASAIIALIGHPAVTFADAPGTMVDVVEGAPELEVVREGDRYAIRVMPQARPEPEEDPFAYGDDDDEKRARQALRSITVVRDSPQRLRVIRLTPAQRRAAQLLSGRFSVPDSAQAELQQTLQSLAGHFHIQSDHAEAAREIDAESRLRAELSPSGESLTLRLVVAPLGPDGPRLMPGAGRARMMAAVKGETIGAQRDLAAERAHLDAVLAAFDFLDPPARGDVSCEWLVEKPDHALDMVELLPQLPGVHAVDWPRGKPVRVITVGSAAVTLKVRSERDWFKLQGQARLDEGLVFELEALVAAAGSGSRFVPMGKGVYAALTRELRDKLTELAAVAETHGGDLRVPQLAAAWLDDVLEGVTAERDAGFVDKVERLRAAQAVLPALPGGLQTELRPYQEDGYVWATRLAQAGFGACLADDMGLGKTIQTLAVLLARAEGGPALVVAPTSVCGNWLAETRRFAPTLNVLLFGEGDRAALIDAAGPRDMVIVSYTLMQQSQEAFAAKTWHTLVADEAQAVKNAAAKRSLALFELAADFRIALSGTPIENRLAELWSIMRFCNPGLLGTITRFNERFAAPIERNRDRDAQRMLRRLISPFVLRRTKSEVLQDLPPRTELVLTITPEPAEAAHYEALRRAAVAVAETAAASEQGGQAHLHILAQLTKLRRAACDPRLTSPGLGIVGAKVRAFADLAAELVANGHKALVFSQFVDFLTILRAPLDEAGIRYQYLDGATPAEERTRRVVLFQAGEGDLFLISLKAGGYGLNLTAADYVVITDPWWNPAAEDQAMGRAHRIGQLRPVTVYRLVGKGTLEERIVELHHDKRALADGVLADSGESAVLPSTDELISLMRGS
jgi:superfamily II DNA or RNA helicase